MTANNHNYQAMIDEINTAASEDWNNKRTRLYIAALVTMYKKSNEELLKDLIFERAVNARSTEFAKALIKEVLAQVSR